MLSPLRAGSSFAAGVLAAVLPAAPVAAQDQQPNEFQSWRLPGWTFTPGVIVGGLFYSNVAIAFPPAGSNGTASDKLFTGPPVRATGVFQAADVVLERLPGRAAPLPRARGSRRRRSSRVFLAASSRQPPRHALCDRQFPARA